MQGAFLVRLSDAVQKRGTALKPTIYLSRKFKNESLISILINLRVGKNSPTSKWDTDLCVQLIYNRRSFLTHTHRARERERERGMCKKGSRVKIDIVGVWKSYPIQRCFPVYLHFTMLSANSIILPHYSTRAHTHTHTHFIQQRRWKREKGGNRR